MPCRRGQIRCRVTSSQLGEEGGSTLENEKIDDVYMVIVKTSARCALLSIHCRTLRSTLLATFYPSNAISVILEYLNLNLYCIQALHVITNSCLGRIYLNVGIEPVGYPTCYDPDPCDNPSAVQYISEHNEVHLRPFFF